MKKPQVVIEDAYIIGDRLYGVPLNHPNPWGLVSNTREVMTSPIVKQHSVRCVETQNTMYYVQNWKQETIVELVDDDSPTCYRSNS